MKAKISHFVIQAVFFPVCLSFIGCDSGLRTQFVEGIVTLNGEPVEGAMVTFVPVADGSSARMAVGTTDARGRYTLTVAEGGSPGRGTTEGEYKVTVAKRISHDHADAVGTPVVETRDPNRPPTAEERMALERERQMMPPARAGLPPPFLFLTPRRYGNPETSGLTATVVRGRNTFNFALEDE